MKLIIKLYRIPTAFSLFLRNYSTNSNGSSQNMTVTFENILSDSNKQRVKQKLLLSKPSLKVDIEKRPEFKPLQYNRQAAVLVPLCLVNGEPSVLFMKRSIHLNKHRGEVSFPGGMADDTDEDLTHTALRETYEEIGLSMDKVDIWGTLAPVPSRALQGNYVTPLLGYCGELECELLSLNKAEVELVFTRTLTSLCDQSNHRQTQFRPIKTGYTLPIFTGGEYPIWGFTAIVLHQVLTMLAPGLYTNKLKHRR